MRVLYGILCFSFFVPLPVGQCDDLADFRKQILERADLVTAWQIENETLPQTDKPGEKLTHRVIALAKKKGQEPFWFTR